MLKKMKEAMTYEYASMNIKNLCISFLATFLYDLILSFLAVAVIVILKVWILP